MILLIAFLLQTTATEPVEEIVKSITSEKIFAHLALLSGDEFEGREAGTAGADKAAEYIAGKLKEWKLLPAGPSGAWFQPFKVGGKPARNVLGVVLGSDPALRKEFVLIGAHYDH